METAGAKMTMIPKLRMAPHCHSLDEVQDKHLPVCPDVAPPSSPPMLGLRAGKGEVVELQVTQSEILDPHLRDRAGKRNKERARKD